MILKKEERIKVSKNFYLDEFINPVDYKNIIGDNYKDFQLLINTDIEKFFAHFFLGKKLKVLINIAQFIRDRYNKPCTINNWGTGGSRIDSGYRNKLSTIGAPLSAHKTMNGIDIVIDGIHENDVYADVQTNQKSYMRVGVTEIEQGTWNKDGEGWTHLGTRVTGLDYIKVIPFWNKSK